MNNKYWAADCRQPFLYLNFYTMKTKTITISTIFISILFPFFALSQINFDKTDKELIFQKNIVWHTNENNADGYRIPGIVVTQKGTVLAFAEERPRYGDADPKSIVVKRSMDSGKTWSENIYIESSNGNFWLQNKKKIDLRDSQDKLEVWTNPAPLVDNITGRIFIFYALNEGLVDGRNLQRYTRVFYKFSDDDGLSWSDRIEITDILNANEAGLPNRDANGKWITDVNGFPCDYLGRAFHMPGPGHGIQLSNGRLLLQVWNRTALGTFDKGLIPVDERKYGICTIYSDDNGDTWEYGSSFAHNGLNGSESRIAELDDGSIYLNTRYVKERNSHRMIAYSFDKGISWSNIEIDQNFPLSNTCDAGLIALKNENQNKTLLLYSKNESLEGRKNLVVRLSSDGGKSWPVSKVVDEGSALYSDLAVLPDNLILLIYETGKNSPLYCVKFNLEWLFKNN